MSLQEALIAQAIKQVDFGKLAHEAVSKIDSVSIVKMFMDGLKGEIDMLKGDADGDGVQDLQEIEASAAIVEKELEKIVKVFQAAHAKKAAK